MITFFSEETPVIECDVTFDVGAVVGSLVGATLTAYVQSPRGERHYATCTLNGNVITATWAPNLLTSGDWFVRFKATSGGYTKVLYNTEVRIDP